MKNWADAIELARRSMDHAREAHRLDGDAVADTWDYSIGWQAIAVAQLNAGSPGEARTSFEEASRLDPRWAEPRGLLARILATSWEDAIRDGPRSVGLAKEACELTGWKDPNHIDTLAAAHAEAGNFEEAARWQRKALEKPDGFATPIEAAKSRLALYESGKPYREPRPAPGPEAKGAAPK